MTAKAMNIYGIHITADVSEKEAKAYVDYLQDKYNRKLEALDIRADGDFVDLQYKFSPVKFDRIRRITGYLVGNMDHWNDAKAAEEKDRVKHSIGCECCGFEQI